MSTQALEEPKQGRAVQIAAAWRNKYGYTDRGGFVLISAGRALGWMPRLDEPYRFRSGMVYAVDSYGVVWKAAGGGNEGASAQRWELLASGVLAGAVTAMFSGGINHNEPICI